MLAKEQFHVIVGPCLEVWHPVAWAVFCMYYSVLHCQAGRCCPHWGYSRLNTRRITRTISSFQPARCEQSCNYHRSPLGKNSLVLEHGLNRLQPADYSFELHCVGCFHRHCIHYSPHLGRYACGCSSPLSRPALPEKWVWLHPTPW